MKNIYLVGGVVVVVLVAGFFLLRGGTSESGVSQSEVKATATILAPAMSLITASSSEPVPLVASTTEVAMGNTLVTSHTGRGLITMSNGSTAVLDYDSSVEIKNLDTAGTHTSLSLVAGSVWARVEKVFGQGEYFEIKTRNAVAVVRGTSFGLTYHADGSTTLFVGKGTVALTPVDPVTGQRQEYKTLTVTAGGKGMIFSNGTTSSSDMKTPDTSADWFRFNNPDTSVLPQATVPAAATTKVVAPVVQTAPAAPIKTTPTVTAPATPATTVVPVQTSGTTCGSSDSGYTTALGGNSLKVTSITPATVSKSSGSTVTLTGKGFACATTLTLGASVLDGESGFVVINDSTMTFSSSALSTGVFDIVITDTLGGTATLPQALTVTR